MFPHLCIMHTNIIIIYCRMFLNFRQFLLAVTVTFIGFFATLGLRIAIYVSAKFIVFYYRNQIIEMLQEQI